MECLDANVVQDLMSGALDANARGEVLGHLDRCEDCRELLRITARETVRAQVGATLVGHGVGEDALAETLAPSDVLVQPRRPTQPTPGHLHGRYQLIDRLGAGAMGVVWRAEDPKLGRKIALKLLRRHDALLTERLIREAQAMAQVNHPNVVAVYDVGVAEGATYIAMELVQGESLRAWQTAQRHTVPVIVEAYIAAGRGLAAAHAAGIIHRDFKPDNVLVGDDGRIRVTDFGLAAGKPTHGGTGAQAIGDVNLTTSGSVLGTPAYMAPEQFTGGNVDPRTDQFNFCVALYEALYGERPFAGKTFNELSDNVCAGRVKPPPAGTSVSGGLRTILLRGMSVKPGDRFPTMEHLLQELGRDRARPWRRTAIGAAALAIALGFGLVADWTVRERGEGQSHLAFTTTGKQIERAVDLQAKRFQAISKLVFLFKAMLDVSSHHDQADFGLASSAQDSEDLEHIHDTLMSQDWTLVRQFDQSGHASQLAVADYKGRLLYTSAAPNEWQGDLKGLPAIKHALDAGRGDFMTVLRYDDPTLTAAKIFGATPPAGLALMFVRPLEHGGEAGGVLIQFIDGLDVLEGIRLDDTQLSLVALDGTSVGEVPRALVIAAPPSGAVEVATDGKSYQVQARTIPDFAGQPIGRFVMARPIDGVLTLFPGARTAFALATLLSLLLALIATWRARLITSARI